MFRSNPGVEIKSGSEITLCSGEDSDLVGRNVQAGEGRRWRAGAGAPGPRQRERTLLGRGEEPQGRGGRRLAQLTGGHRAEPGPRHQVGRTQEGRRGPGQHCLEGHLGPERGPGCPGQDSLHGEDHL